MSLCPFRKQCCDMTFNAGFKQLLTKKLERLVYYCSYSYIATVLVCVGDFERFHEKMKKRSIFCKLHGMFVKRRVETL